MKNEHFNKVKYLLDYYQNFFDEQQFIETDPISIPHNFSKKEDIEIAGYFAATIAWGNRNAIIKTANDLMNRLDNSPFDFITNSTDKEIYNAIKGFYYRTFKEIFSAFPTWDQPMIGNNGKAYSHLDSTSFIMALSTEFFDENDKIKNGIIYFRNSFLKTEILDRSKKHIANPSKGSAAKRINMFLRWMVRKDVNGVDFGLWKNI